MTAFAGPFPLAPAASTGNNNHVSVGPMDSADKVAVELVVEAVGATPTLTYKLQATFDKDTVADASANWVDLMVLPSDSETAAKTFTVTAAGAFVGYLAQANVRFAKRMRLVTSANTNVTYHANYHLHVKP